MRNSKEPQRSNGKLRVAAILKAATTVIAEKGYEAATMAEIAARSDTQIGSLYRFFPNKESLANAMIVRYRENINAEFDKIDGAIASLSTQTLTDALFAIMPALRKDGAAILRLVDTQKGWPINREEFREAVLKRIAQTLRLYNPRLTANLARGMALIVLHNIKTMNTFSNMADKKVRLVAIEELRDMTHAYLISRLNKPH